MHSALFSKLCDSLLGAKISIEGQWPRLLDGIVEGAFFPGKCDELWGALHQGDKRASKDPPMSVSAIIKAAGRHPVHWYRCRRVLRFAKQTANTTRQDLKDADILLRQDCCRPLECFLDDGQTIGVEQLVEFAEVAFRASPSDKQKAVSLFRLLAYFSNQDKPLDPNLSVQQVLS